MKAMVLIVLLCTFVVGSAEAQRTRVGLKAGMNSSTLSGLSNASNRQAFHAGGFARFGWPGRVALQLDGLYSRQGARLSDDTRLNYDYLAFPMVSKVYLTRLLNVQAGAQVAFALSAKSVMNGIKNDLNPFVADFDYSWVVGFGADFRSGISLEGRYTIGVSDTNKNNVPGINARNRTIQLSIGFAFSNRGTL